VDSALTARGSRSIAAKATTVMFEAQRELTTLAFRQWAVNDQEYVLNPFEMIWYTIKCVICIWLGRSALTDHIDMYLTIAYSDVRPTSHCEYNGLDWDELVVGKDKWFYDFMDNSSV
jgi:hypothetical protein